MRVIKARVAAFWWMGLMAALIPVAVCAQPTSTGEIAREFSVVGFDDGKVIRMSDFDGQILILDFFAYWCIHCRASAPDLEANVREYYENRGGNIDGIPVTVLSISIESREPPKTAAFIEEHGVALAANDFEGTGSDAWQQFGAAAIPHFVIINGVADSTTHQQWEVLLSESGYKGAAIMRSLVDSIRRPPQAGKPVITAQPSDAVIEEGGDFIVSVSAQADLPLSYQWLHDGIPIENATGSTYEVRCGQAYHGGGYSVVVTDSNGVGVTSETATVQVNPPTASSSRLMNLSTRGFCLGGDRILIPGFVIAGGGSKKLLIRAVGATLGAAPFLLTDVLGDPMMSLKRWNSISEAFEEVAENDDWASQSNADLISSTTTALGGFALTSGRDAALLVELGEGLYTVAVQGAQAGTGQALVELYDADSSSGGAQLVNISNRGFVGEGDKVMIPGFVVSEDGSRTYLIRVVGPTLGGSLFNVPGTLSDPKLALYRREAGGADRLLFVNDNWMEHPDSENTAVQSENLGAFALDPESKDAALVVTLLPGAYTVVGSSAIPGETGVVLMEIYAVPGQH